MSPVLDGVEMVMTEEEMFLMRDICRTAAKELCAVFIIL